MSDLHFPRSRDLRRGQVSLPGQIYLITTVTLKRRGLFQNLTAGRIVVQAMHSGNVGARTLAYVVMPDHVHWLMQLVSEKPLAKVLHGIKSVSAHRIKKHFKYSSNIWEPGYHDHAVRTHEELHSRARYVIENPVRAGLVSRVEDYSLWDAFWV